MTQQILIVAHVIVSVLMIGIILIQQGKGAEAGASFGSGGSQTVLGATGSVSLLAKLTSYLTVAFFALSFALAYYANSDVDSSSIINVDVPAAVDVPAENIINNSDVPVSAAPEAATSDVPVAEDAVEEDAEGANDVPAAE